MTLVIVGGILVVILVWAVAVFNRLVALRNRFRNAFAQIDVQLKRRHDLVPNLVEVTKGYLAHERQTLEAVVEARGVAESARKKAAADPTDADAVNDLSAAEGRLTRGLGKLIALREAYPELKASENVAQLFEALTSTENRIAFARQAYNDSVMFYNTAREVFPGNLVAASLSFGPAALYQIEDESERALPQAKLD